MKVVDQIRKRIKGLLTAPLEEVGQLTRFLRFQIELWRFCFLRLRKNNAMAMASALSFRTMFAIVPALLLAVLVLKPFGIVKDPKQLTQQVMGAVGIKDIQVRRDTPSPSVDNENPGNTTDDAGKEKKEEREKEEEVVNLADTIEDLITKVESKLTFGGVGHVGVLVLIWTVLTLLTTIERSLNRIFEATRARSLGKRVLLYWSVVTLCPLLFVTASYMGDAGVEALQNMPVVGFLVGAVGWAGSFIIFICLVATVYTLMPNTKVTFRSALGGAVIAVPLWLIAKWALKVYVVGLAQGSIYGALGLIPLFLLWLNLSWWFFLFGAEIAHTAANLDQMQADEMAMTFEQTPGITLAAAVAVAQSFVSGTGPVDTRHIASQVKLSPALTETIVEKLIKLKIISRTDQEAPRAYQLARPAEMIKMSEILQIDNEPDHPGGHQFGEEVDDTVQHFKMHAREALADMSLADVMKKHGQDTL